MENSIVCNGQSNVQLLSNAATTSSIKGSKCSKNADLALIPNLNWLIYLAFARQDYKYCKEVIEYQFAETYDHEYLFYMKGLVARVEGSLEESLKFLQTANDLNPNNLDNLKEIAKTLYKMERYKQALDVFIKIDKISPNADETVCYFIGELLYKKCIKMQTPITDEVKDYFHKSIRDGKQWESYIRLSEIYKSENNLPKAIEMLENLTQLSMEDVDMLTEIGILYCRINDMKGAFDKLFEVTKSHENCSKALLALGSILQSKNDIDGALNKYKLIDVESQKSAEIWNNVGLCFFKKKKFIAAISCLKKSIWMEPTNFSCLFNLGLVYLIAQQYASAFQTLAAAASIRLENAECYMLLGICLSNLNDHGNAQLAFERSVMLSDALKNPLIHLNFAVYCWKMNHYELTQSNLNNFLSACEHINVRHEYKILAERLKDAVKPWNPSSQQTVEVEPSIIEPFADNVGADDGIDGAGETMATSYRENLV